MADIAGDALVKRAMKGDPVAFEELISLYEKRVYQLCLRVSGNRDDALDLAQEALLRIYRNIGAFRGQSQFSTWVYRITYNVCMDELRRRKTRGTVSMEALAEQGAMPEADHQDGPESHIINKELGESIQECLGELPADQRVAVVMRDVQGLAYEEIATALDLNLNTLKSRIARGRQALQQLLKQRGAVFTAGERPPGRNRSHNVSNTKNNITVLAGANRADL